MKRVILTFLALAVAGGCTAFTPDPIEDSPSVRPQRSQAQASLPAQPQSWSYAPQSTKAAAQTTTNKTENTVVKTAYVEAKPPPDELPPGALGTLRRTNNKRITFRIESEDASSGGANMEIWGTTDMHGWRKFDVAARSPSSLAVEVKDEGLYGFTMIARGKDDSAQDQPAAGEQPQVWVAVDLTKPVVQLLDAEMKAEAQTPALIVRWSAKDRNFGPQPISVLYAERPEGPWKPIAANLENNGRYEGAPPPHLSSTVYLRVQAADLMGNIGASQTTALRSAGRSSSSTAPVSHPAGPALSIDGE